MDGYAVFGPSQQWCSLSTKSMIDLFTNFSILYAIPITQHTITIYEQIGAIEIKKQKF